MAVQRKRVTAADECAILALIAEEPRSLKYLADEVGLPQKEVRRVLLLYANEGMTHQLWALTPLATEGRDGTPVRVAARRAMPFTLYLPFPEKEERTA